MMWIIIVSAVSIFAIVLYVNLRREVHREPADVITYSRPPKVQGNRNVGTEELILRLLVNQQRLSFGLLVGSLIVALVMVTFLIWRIVAGYEDFVQAIATLSGTAVNGFIAGGSWKLFNVCNKRLDAHLAKTSDP